MKRPRPDRPTKRAILAHLNAQRPLDAPPIEWERKRRTRKVEDEGGEIRLVAGDDKTAD